MISISDLLRPVRAEAATAGLVEVTRTGGALFVSRRPTLHLILEGQGRIDIPALGEDIAFAAGDLVFVPHGIVHRMRFDPRNRAESAIRADRRQQAPHDDTVPVLRFGSDELAIRSLSIIFTLRHAQANPLIRMLPNLVRQPLAEDGTHGSPASWDAALHKPGAAVFVERLSDVLLVEMIRWQAEKTGMTTRLGSDFVHFAPIERSMFVIGEQPGRDWSLATLASLAGMSRSSYAAAFAQQVGEPPMHYVKRMRMTRAAEILRSTNLDAGAIAAQVGYESGASLTRAFRRFFGLPPGQYRRRFWVEALEAG